MTLLSQIHEEISNNGGRWKLASLIADENPEIFSVRERNILRFKANRWNDNKHWKQEEISYLLSIYCFNNRGEISAVLGRTETAITEKYNQLINQ